MKITQLRQLIREEIESMVKEPIVNSKKWKSILMPFYKEVIEEINESNMSLNVYSRLVGEFIKNCNTYTSYDNLIKYEFNGQDIKTDEDLKNEFIKYLNSY